VSPHRRSSRGTLLGTSLFGLYTTQKDKCLDPVSYETAIITLQAVVTGDLVTFLLIATVATVSWRGSPRVSRAALGNFLLSGVCSAAGIFLLFQAFSLDDGTVSVVDPLSATTPLFTTVFAVVLLRDLERVTLGTILGIVVAGVALITTG
jgi:DME family drug/metabolite transporter